MKELHNANKTCWNCPAIDLAGKVDFRACGQSDEAFKKTLPEDSDVLIMAECRRQTQRRPRNESSRRYATILFVQCIQCFLKAVRV